MGDRFDNSQLQQWQTQEKSPAAPRGQQAAAQAAGGYQSGDPRFENSQLGQYTAKNGYVDQAQRWYSGANPDGVNNGWDTGFYQRFLDGQNKAAKEGTLNTYFEKPDATGVVTWDHASSDGRHSYEFGDIFDNGQKVGNVFTDFDQKTASLMMTDFVLDAKTKAKAFGDSDPADAVVREVARAREQNNVDIPKALAAKKFAGKVDARSDEMQQGVGTDEAIAGGAGILSGGLAAAGTAALAASETGPGALLAGAAGFVVGAGAAWLNRDELTDQAARAYEITKMSSAQDGRAAGLLTGIQEWSGFGSRLISPLSNTVHGLDDQLHGNAGDGESQFYKVDKTGKSMTPKWLKVADVGATLGDSLLQFASPLGLSIYTTQMGTSIAGEVGHLALTGKEFDDRRGGFDSVFTDDSGNFDLKSAAAGIGKVGIDAVQLGMARGLAGKVNSLRSQVGLGGVERLGRGEGYGLLTRTAEKVSAKLPRWAGGQTDSVAAKEALAAGGHHVELGGMKYVVDVEGRAVSRRASLSLLAPSEQLSSLSTGVLARRAAARRDGALSADDFYRAAQAMSTGERKWTSVVVNAMGEGYEEGIQAILEPWSHNASVNGADVFNSAMYGAAAGAGMSGAMAFHQPSQDDKMFALAQTAQLLRTGGVELSRSQWNAMSEIDKRTLAAMSNAENAMAQATYAKIHDDQAAEQVAGVAGIAKLHDAVQTQLASNLARLTDRTDGSFVIVGLEDVTRVDADGNLLPDSMPANAAGSSALQLAANLIQHHRGLAIGLESMKRDLDSANALLVENPGDEDAARRVEDLTRRIDQTRLTLEWSQRFDAEIDAAVERMHAEGISLEEVQAEATVLNDTIRRAFNMETEDYQGTPLTRDDKMALARAVSLVALRDPIDNAGSVQLLVPQVSAALTHARADNLLQVSHAILDAIRGDYDGDKMRQQAQLLMSEETFTNARSGSFFLGAGSSVNIGTPKFEKYIVDYMAESFTSGSATLESFAEQTLQQIAGAIRRRYAELHVDTDLDAVFETFFDAVHAGSKDARATLLDGLAERIGGQLTEFARGRLSNEWLWIDQLVVSTMQNFQELYAAHRPSIAPTPRNGTDARVRQSAEVRERKMFDAATQGGMLAQQTVGESMFRKFQKLHYTSITSPVLSADTPSERAALQEQAMLYEALGQGITQTELDNIRSKDLITARVYAMLRRLSMDAKQMHPGLNAYQAMVVVANLRVQDIEIDERGQATPNGHEITLAQLLLKQSVQRDQREKAAVIDQSPELAAKHNKLLNMTTPSGRGRSNPVNAEKAFIEVVGSQQIFALLGEDANIFGPHLTVEQFLRDYVSKSETDRREIDRKLKADAAYLGRTGKHDMPYNLDEVKNGEVSAYRSLVDAILAVGHHRITIDKDGTLHGEIADRSARVTGDFRAAHEQVRAALQEFAGLSSRRAGELNVEMVQRLIESNPDFARQVMALIPNASANAVLEVRGDQVYAANWLFKMFTLRDSAEAEMLYWRNLLIAQWNALGGRELLTGEDADPNQHGREFDRLPRRMHRVIYKLAKEPDNGIMLRRFLDQMESATDLNEFLRWVNTTPGVRGEQAPLTAWVDDPAEFDPDKAQGGWTTAIAGAELREAITQLRAGTSRLVKDLAEERSALTADVGTLQAIRRVLRKDAGGTVVLDAGDREIYNQFVAAIDNAGELAVGMGPNAMVYQIVGAVRGFYPQAHTKGKNPDNVEPAGAFDAMRDSFDYVTNFERMMGSLTAVNLDAAGSNLGQVAKDGIRSMDDSGRVVVQTKPSPQQMLELLESADTRPLARAILFPQVMERGLDGNLRPQLLVGKSLKSLLNGTTHKELFRKGSTESALRYVSMIEATARKFGGHFSVQRMANDLVIARTSHADHTLSTEEIETMTVEALRDIARVLQDAGSIAASPAKPGTDPLAAILEEVRTAQRRIRTATSLGIKYDEEVLTDVVLDQFVLERERELTDERGALIDSITPENEERVQARIAALEEDFTAFRRKVDHLRDKHLIGTVRDMFEIPTGPIDPRRTRLLVDYVSKNLHIQQQAAGAWETINKLTTQLMDTGRRGDVRLSDDEWREISRAVITHYLDSVVSLGSLTTPLFPDADHVEDQRYFDTTFSYLVEPLLDSKSPMVQAAAELHQRAGLHGDVRTDREMIDTLGRTIFAEHSLGPWTADIPQASIAAGERLYSAAAAPAIAMAGNSPKRQAVISAATRRTFKVPPPELASKVTLTGRDLLRPVFDEVMVTLPGVEAPVHRPLAQLNNRFASSVMLFHNGTEMTDLLTAQPNLGRTWYGNQAAVESPYQAIHLDRLKHAIDAWARENGVSPDEVSVEVSFFHPDAQPAGAEWFNNLFFEGTSFSLDADQHESLNATLWFANGSISPAAQAAALDASKLGKPALQVIDTVSAEDRTVDEADWQSDLAEVLRRKAKRIMEKDLGSGRLDPEFYNAVYKNLKLRHFVRTEGRLVSAEEVIASQLNGGNFTEGAELWIPTDDVLRSLLGEQGTQGAARIFNDQLEIDLDKVPTYRGVTDTMISRFQAGVTGAQLGLADTRVANRARQSQLVVRPMLTREERAAYDARMKYFAERRDEIFADRSEMMQRGEGGFNVRNNLARVLKRADNMLNAENIAFDWPSIGIPFIGPRKPGDTALSKMLLHELAAVLSTESGYRTGWIFRQNEQPNTAEGMLSEVNLSDKRGGGMRVAPGDLVVIELDSFRGDDAAARKAIDHMVAHGATVVLGSADGQGDMRAELSEYLESRNYEQVAGSRHVYKPIETSSRYANPRARESSLTEVRGVSARSHVAILNTQGLGVQEGTAWVKPDNERLGGIGVQMNLVPTDFLAGYNVPVDSFAGEGQVGQVQAHLRGLNSPEGLAKLRELAGVEPGDTSFDEAFRRMIDRFDGNPGSVLPREGEEFGTGDFIPLTDGFGKVLLYRHGYQAPSRASVLLQQAEMLPGKQDGWGVAVYSAKREPAATTHTGTVVGFNPRSGYGLSVELNIPLQVFGDKKQLEWNGMKYVLNPMSKEVVLPDHPFFANGWGIDIVSDAATAFSKESFDGLVDNHRNAFAYFGIDFLPDVTEFFFPGKGQDPDAQRQARELLHTVASASERISVASADELLTSLLLPQSFLGRLPAGADWASRLDQPSVEAQITSAMLVYLMTPGAEISHVLASGGFNNDDSNSADRQSVLMPRLFTQVFDRAELDSELRTEINRRLNAQLYNPTSDGTGYSLSKNWVLEITNKDSKKNLRGFLQFAEAHSSGDNPLKNGMSFDETEKASVSAHSAATLYQAIGAGTAHKYDLSLARAFASGEGVQRFERDKIDGGAWRMFTDLPAKDRSFQSWRAQTPAEAERRSLARDAVVAFRQEIKQVEENGWSEAQRKQYLELTQQIVRTLNLKDAQAGIVDGWVRQILGQPHGENAAGEELGRVTGKGALEAAQDILWNVQNRFLPTVGAEVPMLHVHDLQLIYRENQNLARPWRPREALDPDSSSVTGWDDWVKVSLGSSLLNNELFDPLYLLAVDGFMHSYQNATRSLLDLPVSTSALVGLQLLDEETNRMLVSIDSNTNLLSTESVLLDVQRATLESLIGGQRIAGKYKGKAAPASEVSRRREIRRKWRKENGVPVPVDVTMRNFRNNGSEFIDSSTTTNALARSLINLRVGTALINPALYVSMGPEQWIRGTLDRSANLLTGNATRGRLAETAAKVGLSHFTPDQLTQLNQLYRVLGQRHDFKAMVYRDLMFQRPHAAGIGRVEKWLENYAKFGSRMQDPTWGMRGDTLARRYLEAVIQHIDATPTLNPITVEMLVAELSNDPAFLQKNFPEAHHAGSNSIAQLRSLKPTPLSLALRSVYEPLSESTHGGRNFLGNVVLKIPMLFSGYAMNVATTILGLQGLSDMTAAFADGREKGPNSLFGRIQAKMRGEEFNPEIDATFDMSSVMEGIDLSRSFIRGGLTHTGLFAFGLMAGGLGLSGEDDETKRRRRAAELQGAGFVYDPRRIENDFRNSDAVFLDWLPFGFDHWFRVTDGDAPGGARSMGQMHWMLKQFLSPVIGMERFFETGDFRHVTWGYEDALGAFPLINTMMWSDTVQTAHELAAMANDQAKLGGPENLLASANLLTTAVGTYERMLFENSFVNMLYQSFDKYDRDPYTQVAHNEDGSQRTDALGNPEESKVLQPYIDDQGNVREGYVSRDAGDALLHGFTENRATMAAVLSLFGMGDTSYLRRNMAIKTRSMEKPVLDQGDAEAAVKAALMGQVSQGGGLMQLSADELAQIWKNQAKAAGVYVDWGVIDKEAAAAAKLGVQGTGAPEPLTMLDKNDREHLTHLGARGVFDGLIKGSVKLGDASLAGIYITKEMRDSIQKDWMAELVQEGVDMGLDETKANTRMKRLWYGPSADPTVQGIGDILWSKDISYSDKVEYNQLNTTYVTGPDGRPWATGFTRDGLFGALGLKPVKRAYVSEYLADGSKNATGVDDRLNTTDFVNGMNTGLRALELKPDAHIPTDEEIAKRITDAIEKAAMNSYTPYASTKSGGGGGYGGYHRRGYGRRSYGGGYGGGGGYADFQKMYALPTSKAPYGDSIPFINTSNPIIRRASVRRERVWSERGRLKQWQ